MQLTKIPFEYTFWSRISTVTMLIGMVLNIYSTTVLKAISANNSERQHEISGLFFIKCIKTSMYRVNNYKYGLFMKKTIVHHSCQSSFR